MFLRRRYAVVARKQRSELRDGKGKEAHFKINEELKEIRSILELTIILASGLCPSTTPQFTSLLAGYPT